jgi:hypothetical protein
MRLTVFEARRPRSFPEIIRAVVDRKERAEVNRVCLPTDVLDFFGHSSACER